MNPTEQHLTNLQIYQKYSTSRPDWFSLSHDEVEYILDLQTQLQLNPTQLTGDPQSTGSSIETCIMSSQEDLTPDTDIEDIKKSGIRDKFSHVRTRCM